ncbi:MAG TPA: hypothetical protein GX507_07560 [Clostridia bacterium]|nr:hypothetical protein [Clostridia bacterium]
MTERVWDSRGDSEEINLRDYVEVLLRGKWIIAIITVIAILTSAFVSFFVLEPVYEAKATIMVKQPNLGSGGQAEKDLARLVGEMGIYPQMALETYRSQVRNSEVLSNVKYRLNLDMSLHSLRESIDAEVIKDSNLIRITVRSSDPDKAATIANTLADEYMKFIDKMNVDQISRTRAVLAEQAATEKKNLDRTLSELKALVMSSRSADEIRREIEALTTLLTDYKSRMRQIEVEMAAISARITEARQQLANTPDVIATEKSLLEDPFLGEVVSDSTGQKAKDLAGLKFESEELNPVASTLKEKLAEDEIELSGLKGTARKLQQAILKLEKELESLRKDLIEAETRERELTEKAKIYEDAYLSFSSQEEQARIAEATRLGEKTLTLIEEAIPPVQPVKPRKMLNIAVAGVLGVMVGVFTAFFAEFWRTSTPSRPLAE